MGVRKTSPWVLAPTVKTQKDGGRIDDRGSGCLGQTVDHTGHFHKVAKEKGSQQRNRCRCQKAAQDDADNRKQEQFSARHRSFDVRHFYEAFFPGGQKAHDGRLNDGNQGHIGIGGDGNRPNQVGCQLGC